MQCRKRKVSESIELENKKKKFDDLQSRRRHHSASPNLCEEMTAEDAEGNNHQVVGDNAAPLESGNESTAATTSGVEIALRSTQKPSLMQLLGVRRREFSEMVDQPRNPRVQFMLNLLMKRHKELLLQRAIRSRFTTLSEESEVEGGQAENIAETQNSGVPILESMGASDTIDQLSNILLESSLTVDISSLPQELIDQLGSFLEMGVDLSSFGDELTTVDEVSLNSDLEINHIQQEIIDSVDLSSTTQKVDTVPRIRVNLSSQALTNDEFSNVSRKGCVRNKTKENKSSPKKSCRQAREITKGMEEKSATGENFTALKRIKMEHIEDNAVAEWNRKEGLGNISSPLHSSGLAGEERTNGEVNCKTGENMIKVTLGNDDSQRRVEYRNELLGRGVSHDSSKFSVKSNTGNVSGLDSLGDARKESTTESNDHLLSMNNGANVVTDRNQSVTTEKMDSVVKVPLENLLSLSSPEEEETEEKILAKMWEIDLEIGKLMEKKQELYNKLNKIRNLKIISHRSVSVAKDNQESMQKSTPGQSECSDTKTLHKHVMSESLSDNIAVKVPKSHSPTIDLKLWKKSIKISPDKCDSAKNKESTELNEALEIVQTDVHRKDSSMGQCSASLGLCSGREKLNVVGQSKDENLEIVYDSCDPPNIIKSGGTEFFGHKETVLAIKVTKKFLYVSCADFCIYCYHLHTKQVVRKYLGHSKMISSLYVHPGPRGLVHIYSGSHDETLLQFNAKTEQLLHTYNVDEPITCMEHCWGILFIGTKGGTVERFNILKSLFMKPTMTSLQSEVMAIQTSKEGPRRVLIIATRDKPIVVRDSNTGLLLRSINDEASKHTIYTIHVHHGLVFTGSSIFGLTAVDFTNGKFVKQYKGCGTIVSMQIVNEKIFAASYDGNIYIYDCEHSHPKHIIKATDKMLLCLAVRDSKIYAGSLDRKLQVWKSPI